jgi:hypothetical protein
MLASSSHPKSYWLHDDLLILIFQLVLAFTCYRPTNQPINSEFLSIFSKNKVNFEVDSGEWINGLA